MSGEESERILGDDGLCTTNSSCWDSLKHIMTIKKGLTDLVVKFCFPAPKELLQNVIECLQFCLTFTKNTDIK